MEPNGQTTLKPVGTEVYHCQSWYLWEIRARVPHLYDSFDCQPTLLLVGCAETLDIISPYSATTLLLLDYPPCFWKRVSHNFTLSLCRMCKELKILNHRINMPPEVKKYTKPIPSLGHRFYLRVNTRTQGLTDGQLTRQRDYFKHFIFVVLHLRFLSCVCHEVKSPGELI